MSRCTCIPERTCARCEHAIDAAQWNQEAPPLRDEWQTGQDRYERHLERQGGEW